MVYTGTRAVKGKLAGYRNFISFALPDRMPSRMTTIGVKFESGKPSAGIT
jgi:hypothetical protein